MQKGCNFIASQALSPYSEIVLSNDTLIYCITLEQFLIQVPSEVRHAEGAHQKLFDSFQKC